jgi:hypothetical protein
VPDRRLGVTVREYRELEAGERWPTFETWDRICKLYGWPQTFVGGSSRGRSGLEDATFSGTMPP